MLWKLPQPLFADLATPPSPLVFIDDQEASDDAQIDISWSQEFARVYLLVSDLTPVTANVEPRLRTSSDGGTTFDAGAADYRYIATSFAAGALGQITPSGVGASFIPLTDDANNLVDTGALLITVHRPFDTSLFTVIRSYGGGRTGSLDQLFFAHTNRDEFGKVNALRFFMETGNISTGRFFAWGSTS